MSEETNIPDINELESHTRSLVENNELNITSVLNFITETSLIPTALRDKDSINEKIAILQKLQNEGYASDDINDAITKLALLRVLP